ncbi:DUF3301 domain-containing protein [Vibrio marisflavi]|uniref:DUF3301 domain-containing protein n=1 Tax=Vibrio marisflavi CECT 7928 TaxID=634439 RepID=A0ABM9A306_9VIBR|nr:DUF3301 domain-containing protein [Vibrio marisflavi]CAH0538897.1 hypothetical protein VMF7928_01745 [Vibrio marisflavi CECT 7928]
MLSNLVSIFALCLICFLFWQQRRQAEVAKAAIAHKCKQLELQLVSVALGRHRLKDENGRWYWNTSYQFEFSSLGDDCYQGTLIMKGFRPLKFQLPPHRV